MSLSEGCLHSVMKVHVGEHAEVVILLHGARIEAQVDTAVHILSACCC